jgi:predicted N-formylglutamate amidohydrolase
MSKTDHVLITCEHGGNRIPACYRHLFAGFEAMLTSHRGHDPGARVMARELALALDAPLFVSTTSRLLVDLNRSIGHPKLFSEATRDTPVQTRRELLEKYYLPYRNKVEAEIVAAIARGKRVIHVASHSFTPILDGEIRQADIGLLYDPERPGEVDLCHRWQARLKAQLPGMKVRRNYPYQGRSDGLTAYLRRRFPAEVYAGIELEINQKHVSNGVRQWFALRRCVTETLRQAMTECGWDARD